VWLTTFKDARRNGIKEKGWLLPSPFQLQFSVVGLFFF
jgi:hypothetical protein